MLSSLITVSTDRVGAVLKLYMAHITTGRREKYTGRRQVDDFISIMPVILSWRKFATLKGMVMVEVRKQAGVV